MAGFALTWHRDGRAVDRDAFGRTFAALDHRGPDGGTVRWLAGAALGHQHFHTTPEEAGPLSSSEVQPVASADGRRHLVLDGRLDNRDELAAALELPGGGRGVSDARLALAAYERWGKECFGRLVGPFAIAVVDLIHDRVICARDALGDRSLFYRHLPDRDGGTLLVASEESALLAHPEVSRRWNETTLARFFAVAPPEEGETFFAEVRELPPATAMAVDGGGLRSWRHWRHDPSRRLRYRRDADYAEHFRELLATSVGARLRTPAGSAPPAVLMSGGLDSTTVAALAARGLAAAGDARPLSAVSWVFDELAESDEREYIDRLVAAYGLDPVAIVGDDAWPLADLATWPRNPNAPLEGVYRRLMERAYGAVRTGGGMVLLTGDGGDQLYGGEAYWLRDLLAEGRLAEAGAGLARTLTGRGRWGNLRGSLARTVGWRRTATGPEPVWLTPDARARAAGCRRRGRGRTRRPEQEVNLLDPRSAYAASLEVANASRAGVDVRRPFRDRRLVEFALAVPAHQLFRPGWTRWVLRQAMAGILPEPVRLRRGKSSLLPLCERGLVEREAATVAALLGAPDALWPRYVRRDWLHRVFPQRLAARIDGLESVVAWRCICAELWRGSGAAVAEGLAATG